MQNNNTCCEGEKQEKSFNMGNYGLLIAIVLFILLAIIISSYQTC